MNKILFIKKSKIVYNNSRYSNSWIKIADGTCSSGTRCINSSNLTSETAYLNPCISINTCTGTIQVITEDRNGNPMSGLRI